MILSSVAFLWVVALLGFSQPNYAMDPPSLDAREEVRIATLAKNLDSEDADKVKAIDYVRVAIGNYIVKKHAKHLRKLFESVDMKMDLKTELNKISNTLPPFLYRALQKEVSDELIEVLLEYGANPNIKLHRTFIKTRKDISDMVQGSTAVHIAVKNKRSKELLLLLAKFGADFREPDIYGSTPLKLAKDNQTKETIETILGIPKENPSKSWRAERR